MSAAVCGLGLLLCGCGLQSDTGATYSGPVRLGFVNGGSSQFNSCLQKAVVESAGDNLARVRTANSRQSPTIELSNVKDMIAHKVNAIILMTVDASALKADIAAAKKAGIPVVLTALLPPDGDKDILGAVLGQVAEAGKLDAQWVAQDADGESVQAGVVFGDGSTSSDLMAGGFTKNLPHNVEVVASEPGGFNKPEANAAAARMIQAHPDIRYVFVASEEMAFGVREALDAAGAGTVKIVTVNGSDAGLAALKDGRFSATVSSSVKDLGDLAVTQTLSLLRKDKTQKIVYVPSRLVTKDSADTAPLYCPSD
ncbi:substrate-binding domain-containing protein [Streptomyces sp. NPDC051576]|uniref:sugar ABC transporter substrate-binding protein n=1 Tax=Streptomyces sp. NPDC051576 TaxID=3155803 RepID=UPI00342A59E5